MTLVVLMGVGAQQAIASSLIARGWPPATPAAVLFAASREDAETWVGSLLSMSRGSGPAEIDRPGTLVIGDVVHLRAVLATRHEDAGDAAAAEKVV